MPSYFAVFDEAEKLETSSFVNWRYSRKICRHLTKSSKTKDGTVFQRIFKPWTMGELGYNSPFSNPFQESPIKCYPGLL